MIRSVLPALVAGAVLALLIFAASLSQRAMHRMESVRPEPGTPAFNSSPNRLVERERLAELFPETLVHTAGYRYSILEPGEGRPPILGNIVAIRYTGRLLDGTVFESNLDHADPYTFRLGAGQVIPGWDKAVAEMHPGERRKLILPFRLGYGAVGRPPLIPSRAALLFDIKLVEVRPADAS
ncbi:MAG: FKBP-type peptidyl-prolyl cis-trans isomerase [Puniceicoccaceae bacterium]|nr:MAG: FKBP-type peptidyl-prolyl cis-trans isomerase [Puniceicoccaceae bacterium]